jgi:tetratricopeptide (TPR) repeat protein
MRFSKLGVVVACVLVLGGCATQRVVGTVSADAWQDQAFQYNPALVTETRETLFGLDDALVRDLKSDDRIGFSTEKRMDILLSRLYGPNGIRLAYTAGHTTGAAQTWREKRGDCLSLTILAYTAAKFLGIEARMQEVSVPVVMDRREGFDLINGHVNLFVRNKIDVSVNGSTYGAGSFVIDFEPQGGSLRPGMRLSEEAIMARFYNNRATEYLLQRNFNHAYAYYRAALVLAPDYAPAFNNLAQLYARTGYYQGAEKLLRQAMALGGEPTYVQLASMQRVLTAQGRVTEAQLYADQLARRQDEDPYYWLGLGIKAVEGGQWRNAISALERAEKLTTGFEEIHFYLGVAYSRNGQPEAANKQLAAMRAINSQGASVALLSKKLQGLQQPTAVVY